MKKLVAESLNESIESHKTHLNINIPSIEGREENINFKSFHLNQYYKNRTIDYIIDLNGYNTETILDLKKLNIPHIWKLKPVYKEFIKSGGNNMDWGDFCEKNIFKRDFEYLSHTFLKKFNNVLIHHGGSDINIFNEQRFLGHVWNETFPVSYGSGNIDNLTPNGLSFAFLLYDVVRFNQDNDTLNMYGAEGEDYFEKYEKEFYRGENTGCIITKVNEAMLVYSNVGDVIEILFDTKDATYEKLYVYIKNEKIIIRFSDNSEKVFDTLKKAYNYMLKYFNAVR